MAEGGSQVLEGDIDGREGRAGRDDEEGCGDEHLGQDDAGHRSGETLVEESTQGGIGTDDVDEQDAAHHWWQGERQNHQHPDRVGQQTAVTGEGVCQRDAQNGDDERGYGGALC